MVTNTFDSTGMRPIRIAVVGSGPSGFYAAEALLQSKLPIEITMIERLPVPFGLVRSGVAPDHPKLKQSTAVFEKIAAHPSFRLFGNVEVGLDLTVDELLATHHGVIFAYGASLDRRLGIPGEELKGSHAATEFVGWYNGHPDFRELKFDFHHEAAIIVGQGNVALDVARILLKPVDMLRGTDIAEHALDALARSRVRRVHIVGRRGPAQAKFSPTELKEFSSIEGVVPVVEAAQLLLSETSQVEASDKLSRNIASNLNILSGFANDEPAIGRSCHFHFFRDPVAVSGVNRVMGVTFAKTKLIGDAFGQSAIDTNEFVELSAGLLFRSIGYRGCQIQNLPFDVNRGTLLHEKGRLVGSDGSAKPGLYATGWIKRGPSGIIGTNRADSLETVATLMSDISRLSGSERAGASGVEQILASKSVRHVGYEDWKRIDEAEIGRGQLRGKPREKFTCVEAMLAACANVEASHPV